jgi:hypothetical protein
MAGQHLAQSFEKYGCDDPSWACRATVIKIIELEDDSKKQWQESDFWKWCEAEHIEISFLQHPCVLHRLEENSSTPTLAQIEIKNMFTNSFFPKIELEPVAGAICVSHLRALHEARAMHPSAKLIIVLEGDVETTVNTVPLMASFLANWYCNENLKFTNYAALSFSDWHMNYAKKMRDAKRVPNSKVGMYFELYSLPVNANRQSYDFIGQGARALAFEPEFAAKVLDTKVSAYWDLHLLNMLTKEAEAWQKHKWATDCLAVVCTPVIFSHVPDMGDRFRGSGRLHSLAASPSEHISYFITLDLSREWGMSNRLPTMVLWMMFCSTTSLGLYVLWEKKKACPCNFYDVFTVNIESSPTARMPFLKVFDDAKHHMWKAALTDTAWNIGHVNSQTQVHDGFSHWIETWMKMSENLDDARHEFLKERLSLFEDILAKQMWFWDKFDIILDIWEQAKAYAYENLFHVPGQVHAGFHIRRGDMKKMNLEAKLKSRDLTDAKKNELKQLWDEADRTFEDLCSFNSVGTCYAL